MPLLTVIVRTRNSSGTIEACLASIRKSVFKDYEIIIIDTASTDATLSLVNGKADRVINCPQGTKLYSALKEGFRQASAGIVVNIDSDVTINPDTLAKILNYFAEHQDVDGITGRLAFSSPVTGFFSQYKNIYMYYVFSRLPQKVTFLYGSIFAARNQGYFFDEHGSKKGEDLNLGQRIISFGKTIILLKDLEVTHLKKYSFVSFYVNDFVIPFHWAVLFVTYRGWNELRRKGIAFAHASKTQIASIIVAVIIGLIGIFYFRGEMYSPLLCGFLFIWGVLNYRFFRFILNKKGFSFFLIALPVTFLDNIVMAAGIGCGFIYQFIRNKPRNVKNE